MACVPHQVRMYGNSYCMYVCCECNFTMCFFFLHQAMTVLRESQEKTWTMTRSWCTITTRLFHRISLFIPCLFAKDEELCQAFVAGCCRYFVCPLSAYTSKVGQISIYYAFVIWCRLWTQWGNIISCARVMLPQTHRPCSHGHKRDVYNIRTVFPKKF